MRNGGVVFSAAASTMMLDGSDGTAVSEILEFGTALCKLQVRGSLPRQRLLVDLSQIMVVK